MVELEAIANFIARYGRIRVALPTGRTLAGERDDL